ncbi:MAG: tetratricopeptide repeat protein [Chitinophagaceae bacterium]|nr:tetratricopeptide repeat protein [Chitinophagaceae bacterium]
MKENPFNDEQEDIEDLLVQYENLRAGKRFSFIDEDSFERIIDYFLDEEKMTAATEAVSLALEYFPFSSILMLKKADLLISSRKYDDALNILAEAAIYDSSDINLYILQTDAYLAIDQQEKAVQVLEEALLKFDGEQRLELLFELADVYDDYEEFDKVFDCLKLILEDEPANQEALYKICFWTDFTGRNEESIRIHLQIIDIHPYNELAWFNLGAAYQGLKLFEKAIDAYQYAVTIEEKFDFAYRNMGDAYIRLRKYKNAIECLEKVLELSRPEEVLYEALGHCWHRLDNFAQARFNYRKASHMSPDDSKLYYKIAMTYMNEEQWEPAVKMLESAMRIHKNMPEYSLAMAECKMSLGNYKEALQYFGNVIRLRPKSANGWDAFMRCLFKAGMYEQGAEQCLVALKMLDHKPVFIFYYAAFLLQTGQVKEALLQLEKAMQAAPRLVKKFIELNPPFLQHSQVVDVIARYKKSRKI